MKYQLKPILKWAGGKRLVFPEIKKRLPKKFNRYFEPFIGGGYVWLAIQPEKSFINDFNFELINLYRQIKDNPDELIKELKKLKNNEETFYKLRNQDRDKKKYEKISLIKKAARILFLNKTCFNGLYRVNSNGEINVPFGRYKNPNICDDNLIKEMSRFLNNTNTNFTNADFYETLKNIRKGDFVYIDPPYDPISKTSSFTGYSINGFNESDQIRVKKFCDQIHKKNAFFMVSNSSTKFINDLYKEYNIEKIMVNRSISCKSGSRKKIEEVLITNYDWKS